MSGWIKFRNEFMEMKAREAKELLDYCEQKIDSPIERIAYIALADELDYLIKTGKVDIKLQHEILRYRADIFIEYRHQSGDSLKIVVECDGHDFHERTKEQASKDKKRDREMLLAGIKVLRYTGSDIVKGYEQIIDDVYGLIVDFDDKQRL